MNFKTLAAYVKTEDFHATFKTIIPSESMDMLAKADIQEIEQTLAKIFTDTVNAEGNEEWALYRVYYIVAWYHMFKTLQLPADMHVYEIAAGDSIYVPQALEAYSADQGKYVSFNLNKELTQNFIAKTAKMGIDVRVIEDNGIHVLHYFHEGSFDVIAFQHAINDIIQTIVADIDGIDTLHHNWWEIEPQMLRAVYTRYRAGTLKETVYEKFIDIIKVCSLSLKKGGYMIFDNCTFNATYDEAVYSTEFHSLYIDMARKWIAEAGLGLEEIKIDGYQSKWWMVLRKI